MSANQTPTPTTTPVDVAAAGAPGPDAVVAHPATGLRAAAPIGWASYDLVYSLFYFVVVSLCVSPWVVTDHGYPDIALAIATTLVAAGEIVLLPLLGAFADRTGQRLLLFAALTTGAALTTVAVGVVGFHLGIVVVIALFWLLLTLLQLGFAQYEPLLPSVVEAPERARLSGLATGLGLVGVLIASILNAALPIDDHRQFTFLPAALLLLVGLVPCVLAIRTRVQSGRRHRHAHDDEHAVVHLRLRDLPQTFRDLRHNRPAVRLLLAKFLYTDALITLNAYIVIYMDRLGIGKLTQGLALVTGVLVGAIAAFTMGRVVERVGPRLPVVVALPVFGVTAGIGAALGTTWTVWIVGPVLGATLGTVWTTDRVWMLRLVPPAQRGEMFGFFNLANRASAALGPVVLWSSTIALLHSGTGWLSELGASRVALALLGAAAIAGWAVVRGLSDDPLVDDAA